MRLFFRCVTDACASAPDSRGPAEDAVGLDTLEEEEEKSKFFAKLQAEVSSPVDYSKLMGALDSTGSSAGKTLGCVQAQIWSCS